MQGILISELSRILIGELNTQPITFWSAVLIAILQYWTNWTNSNSSNIGLTYRDAVWSNL